MAAQQNPQVIVVGGGLAGLSAAHTVLQNGFRVLLLDKSAFLGGNSTKATSGMNGSETQAQRDEGVPDTNAIFEEDTVRSATGIKTGPCPPSYPLAKVLTHNSGPAVEWIGSSFNLKLDTVSRLGGHSHPRTHRAKTGSRFPGMMITYALMEKLEEIAEKQPERARIITKARANKLITDPVSGEVIGCEYLHKGETHRADGPVVISSGGYAAGGLFADSLLQKVRPDLMNLPTTNGVHCTGDGVDMALSIGAGAVDLKHVQVHPTGLVHPDDPENRVKFLAAECLRGEGGILLDRHGKRFCNELGTRDYVTGMMWKNEGPFRLILNGRAARNIEWHVKHYTGRGVMAPFQNATKLAETMGVSPDTIRSTFDTYNGYAKNGGDPWNTSFHDGAPFSMDEPLHVAIVTPVVHYTMGGVKIDDQARVQRAGQDTPVPGLFAAGEATGGVHGRNRLGGSALLECVVFGRVAGGSAVAHLKNRAAGAGAAAGAGPSGSILITVPQANGKDITIRINGAGGAAAAAGPSSAAPPAPSSGGLGESTTSADISTPAPPAHADGHNIGERMHDDNGASSSSSAAQPKAAAAPAKKELKEYTLEEVAKHNTEDDCWVVVNGEVLDVTEFMDDHPGGKMAIMTFAGKDSTEEFNMVHEPNTVEKYAKEYVIGVLKPSSRL